MHLENHLPLLLDLLLKSAAVLLLAAGAAIACCRSSAANRHTVWLAAFCALALLPVTKFAKPRWAYTLNTMTTSSATAGAPDIVSKMVLPAVRTIPAGSGIAAAPVSWRTAVNWPAAGVVFWLAGAVLFLMRRAMASWRLQQLVRRSVAAVDERALAMADALAAESGVRVRVRVSEKCRIPLALGVWRPVVLLPMQALAWSDARLVSAFRHEMGHVRRGDCLTRLLADLLCAAYWVNPLIWIAARAMRVAQEQACDDLVLCSGADAADYASQLVDVVRSLGEDRHPSRYAVAMAEPSTLETRVRSIVDETRDRRPLSRPVAAGGAVAVVAFLVLCGVAQLSAAEKPESPATSEEASSQAGRNTPQVEIDSKFIEFSGDAVDALKAMGLPVPQGPDTAPSGVVGLLTEEQAQSVFKGINQAKGVDLLSSPRVTTMSKKKATIQTGREFRYATKFSKGKTPGTWKPEAFETKDVGITLQVKPTVTADGTVELVLASESVIFLGYIDLDDGGKAVLPSPVSSNPMSDRLVDTPPPTGHRSQPIFSTRTVTTSVALRDGQTVVLNIGQDDKTPAIKAENRRLVVLVTAKILKPEDGSGPVTITSDSMTHDSATGVTKATGNVKIETPQGAITAEAAEFKQRAGAAAAPEATALERAGRIVIPKAEFQDASLREVVDYLRQKSIELDPEHKGINIVVIAPDRADARITLVLRDVPVADVLKYVAGSIGLELSPGPDAITLQAPRTKPAEVR